MEQSPVLGKVITITSSSRNRTRFVSTNNLSRVRKSLTLKKNPPRLTSSCFWPCSSSNVTTLSRRSFIVAYLRSGSFKAANIWAKNIYIYIINTKQKNDNDKEWLIGKPKTVAYIFFKDFLEKQSRKNALEQLFVLR